MKSLQKHLFIFNSAIEFNSNFINYSKGKGMKKKIFITMLCVLAAFNVFADSGELQVEQLEVRATEIFTTKLEYTQEEGQVLADYQMYTHSVAVAQITEEANELGVDRDTYVEGSDSINRFMEQIRDTTSNLNSLTDREKLFRLNVIGSRYQIQSQVRFPQSNYFEMGLLVEESIIQIIVSLVPGAEEQLRQVLSEEQE